MVRQSKILRISHYPLYYALKSRDLNNVSAQSQKCFDHRHQGGLPKGRSFTANAGTTVTVLLKRRSSTVNSGTKVAVLIGINRCGSFP